VHPDDISWVTAEVDKAVSTVGPYDAEYRVCRPDGTTRWIQARGRVEPDADGNPYRMLGTLWDTTESRVACDGIRSALRYMRDGFLSVDRAWWITFANVAAERLLRSPRKLTGRLLWDLLVIRRVPGLESRCRKAAAGRTSAHDHWKMHLDRAVPALIRRLERVLPKRGWRGRGHCIGHKPQSVPGPDRTGGGRSPWAASRGVHPRGRDRSGARAGQRVPAVRVHRRGQRLDLPARDLRRPLDRARL
jgi:PAS domain-containing protein